MRIVREWHHVRLMKRSGRGHTPLGISGAGDGECAVLCPACPHPEKNLPPDWKQANKSKQYVLSTARKGMFLI